VGKARRHSKSCGRHQTDCAYIAYVHVCSLSVYKSMGQSANLQQVCLCMVRTRARTNAHMQIISHMYTHITRWSFDVPTRRSWRKFADLEARRQMRTRSGDAHESCMIQHPFPMLPSANSSHSIHDFGAWFDLIEGI
jgi:hypothetical protein